MTWPTCFDEIRPPARGFNGTFPKRLDDVFDRQFWREDFLGYTRSEIHPPQHKLSKLLACEPVRRMLSQPDSSFDLREVMDSGKILLVDLSAIDSEPRDILGGLLLSLLHQATISRSDEVGRYRQFHIYCDGAYHFMGDATEDLIAEARRFGVSLTLAHQRLGQFGQRKIDALSSVGATVVFDVAGEDAQHLLKDFPGKVEVEDLVGQPLGHAIARIGTDVVRLTSPAPLSIPAENSAANIVRDSHCRYYRLALVNIRDARVSPTDGGEIKIPERASSNLRGLHIIGRPGMGGHTSLSRISECFRDNPEVAAPSPPDELVAKPLRPTPDEAAGAQPAQSQRGQVEIHAEPRDIGRPPATPEAAMSGSPLCRPKQVQPRRGGGTGDHE